MHLFMCLAVDTNEEDSFCHTQYMCSGDVFEEHNGMMHFVFIAFLYLGITEVTSRKQQWCCAVNLSFVSLHNRLFWINNQVVAVWYTEWRHSWGVCECKSRKPPHSLIVAPFISPFVEKKQRNGWLEKIEQKLRQLGTTLEKILTEHLYRSESSWWRHTRTDKLWSLVIMVTKLVIDRTTPLFFVWMIPRDSWIHAECFYMLLSNTNLMCIFK